MQKMSPLWIPRQAHRVDGGTSFIIGDWKVRVGELRITGGQGQGRVRGCICEVEFLFGDDDEEEDHEEIEGLAKAFFEGLIQGSDVDLAGMRIVGTAAGKENKLVRQYMELLKFART
jgi:TATA-binding related factor (TRF) of subunit 20 of Mediator complex